jgi:hypothetical protein
MSGVVKDNLRMGENAWWFKVNGFVRDAINNSRAYACAKLRMIKGRDHKHLMLRET